MKAFISYSSKQLKQSQDIKKFLLLLDIESFVANDDLRVATNWKKSIIENLSKCDLFIPLLSADFLSSKWCSQEMGIAYIRRKKIIPISIDGTESYGFINHIQSKSIKSYEIEIIISEGLLEHKIENRIRGIIYLLRNSNSYRYSEKVFRTLEPYFISLERNEINEIVKVAIENIQIWGAGECSKRILPKLIKERKSDIEELLMRKLLYQIEKQEWYRA